jgi:hypothetical protein
MTPYPPRPHDPDETPSETAFRDAIWEPVIDLIRRDCPPLPPMPNAADLLALLRDDSTSADLLALIDDPHDRPEH